MQSIERKRCNLEAYSRRVVVVMAVRAVVIGLSITTRIFRVWGYKFFLISKACSGHVPLVLLSHFSDFSEVQRVVRNLATFLVPIPELGHR